jgi:segregation and condensation protein B
MPVPPDSAAADAVSEWVRGDLPRPDKERELRAVRPAAATPASTLTVENGALSLEAQVESLLFVADGPVPVARLAEALEVTPREVEAALASLNEAYKHRGLSVQRLRDKVQLTTAPATAARVERFLGLASATPLTRASLEALAIVAYQQPVTRPQIDSVRGVNSDSVIKNLLGKGLIEEVGRTEGPGRPVLYATTSEFLQYFGLASLADLPPLNLDQPPTLSLPSALEPSRGIEADEATEVRSQAGGVSDILKG